MYKALSQSLKNLYWSNIKRKNFSQGGEEIFLKTYFKDKLNGFYIDVGCHDPYRYSNTAFLYKLGWTGINIDANEKSIERFKKYRDRDKNIRALVFDEKNSLKYYYFNDHALNGVLENDRVGELLELEYKIIKIENLQTITLDKILENNRPPGIIDLLNIDVEGKELNVLNSIDLNKYFVKIIMVEQNNNLNQIENYLLKFNYRLKTKVDRNLVFEKG